MRDGAATTKTRTQRGPPAPANRRPAETRLLRFAVPLVIAALTFAAFLPVLHNGFVSWDDDKNFVENPHFRGLGLEQLHWMWTTFHMGHYVPLSWMTLGADYSLWGMNPGGYHLTSLMLHAANAVVVFFLARTLLASNARKASGDEDVPVTLAAAFAALVFALHPLRVESVAWATERRDVLSGLFFFLSILIYMKSRELPSRARGYWIAVVLFVCALLSKATSMSLPAVLLILNVFPLKRLGGDAGWKTPQARRVYLELVPFAMLAAATGVLSIVALHPPDQLRLTAKLSVSAYSLAFYLSKTLLPFGLSPLYEMPQRVDPAAARFVVCAVIVLCVAGLAWALRRRAPAVTATLSIFFVVTLPMLGVVQNGPQIAADRYTYHAAPALAVLGGVGLLLLMRRARAVAGAVAAVMVLGLTALTWDQSAVWHDSQTLWARVLETDDESSIAHSAMSNLLYQQNRVAEGLAQSERAVAIAPDYPEAINGVGVGLAREGRVADAIEKYRRALTIKPAYDDAEANWGVALAQSGDISAAIDHYRRALEINPNNSNANVNWGNALVRLNRYDEAISHYQAALRIRADNAEAQHNWGVALAQQKRFAEAIEHFRAALAIEPGHVEARQYLDLATRLLREQTSPVPP
jgi:protein O-mannosyl-transferase